MLGDVVLVRQKRSYTTELQDALAAVEDGQLVYRCKVFSELLIIKGMRNLSATALTGIEVE